MVEDLSNRRNKALIWMGKKAYPKLKSMVLSRGMATGVAAVSTAGVATIGSVAIADSKIDDVERRLTPTTVITTTTTTIPVPLYDDSELEARINERLEELGVKIDTHSHPTTTHTHATTSTTVPMVTTTTVVPEVTTTTTTVPPPPTTTTTTTVPPPPTTTTTREPKDDPSDHNQGKGNDDRDLIGVVFDLLF